MSLEKSKNPRDVIVAPVVSEKSYACMDRGQYTFLVAPGSNKTEIKQAVEAIFGVKVESVNTQNRPGKTRRTRTGLGRTKATKRAIVTLREGTIDIFGDVAK
ncbi:MULTISPECIES: 50S ribosomal protein L23 [unclassified Actinomyces]|uniref:50S ribosomal protein L23 n=1 Tax=unclassified Actinomyces TaxID=2609248 RepID=UPI0020180874|nr:MULTISPECIES: 50S ribosomal protein L23 [unclassified Actinomyces]MCL3777047.1 50S ribosomal protein L23 [Actinomyces sp. AC-20-1]MCL3789378.1 50S ribosomal protein L23 [Actinomyces sp. 187325]MCL3791268.1 50S ribosomal protein L23 [Actinomyces sp. 186855]MCL3793771.1 50S ribosomal protein L23 [Actinomyces sp. 217892]